MIAYAITDPSIVDFTTLADDLSYISERATMIVYRDKKTSDYIQNAKIFLESAKGFEKVLLHTDYKLAHKLGAGGVHLQSGQLEDINQAKALGLFVIVSTHTKEEAEKAVLLGADMITCSPIFDTPNKGKALGIEYLKSIVSAVTIPVIALGGILTQEQIASCEEVGASGFASIRYFERKLLN
jgi:thiamine-phosphate pyrophosphorylase